MLRARVCAAIVGVLVLAGCSASPAPTEPRPRAERTPSERAERTPSETVRYRFPVEGHADYERAHHDYPATDVLAVCGTPVLSVTGGVVLEVSREDRFDPKNDDGAERGGLSVSILGDDGVRYYGSHFATIDPAVRAGTRVAPGTRLGTVGRTGNTNGTCHLHFGLSPACARTGDWWIRRGVVWPWPYLDAWRAGTPKSPAEEVNGWHAARGCPTAPSAR